MKLRKQAPAKALIVCLSLGAFAAFFALVRAEPRIQAQAQLTPSPAVDYRRFFAPNASVAPEVAPATPAPRPHARSRAS